MLKSAPPGTETPSADERTVVLRASDSSVLQPGAVLGHTYVIEGLIARGGMGEVYRARHVEFGTAHAIKVILPSLALDPRIVRLLIEEGRKLAQLRHDAIVSYEGLFRGEDGLRYLVMEFIEGQPLTRLLENRRLEPAEVLQLRDRLAEGLAAAHDRGIIHRDVSPENILLPGGDVRRAKLIDFGIAKSLNPGELTLLAGDFAGKFSFVSPEQAGLFEGRVDARSDIYSLGLVLAAAALGFGRKLDMGSAPAQVIAARQKQPDLSELPPELRPVIAPMLRPDPNDRPASMRELLKPGAGYSAPSRRRWLAPVLAVALAGLAAAAGIALYPQLIQPTPPRAVPVEQLRAELASQLMPYRCAALAGSVSPDRAARVSGHVASQAELEKLRTEVAAINGLGRVEFDLGVMIWPHCEVSAVLQPLAQLLPTEAPKLALTGNDVRVGDNLAVDVRAPGFDGYVYVDYYDREGEVLHLLPNSRDRSLNLKPSRNHFVLGCPPLYATITLDGVQRGEQLITLLATPKPLFAAARPDGEPARAYLAALDQAITRQPAGKSAAALMFFSLGDPRPQPNRNACPSG